MDHTLIRLACHVALIVASSLASCPLAAQRRQPPPRAREPSAAPRTRDAAAASTPDAEFDGMIASLAAARATDRSPSDGAIRTFRALGGQAARSSTAVEPDLDVEVELSGGAELGYLPEAPRSRWSYGGAGTSSESDYNSEGRLRSRPVWGPTRDPTRRPARYAAPLSRPRPASLRRRARTYRDRLREQCLGGRRGPDASGLGARLTATWARAHGARPPLRDRRALRLRARGDQVVAHAGITLGGTIL